MFPLFRSFGPQRACVLAFPILCVLGVAPDRLASGRPQTLVAVARPIPPAKSPQAPGTFPPQEPSPPVRLERKQKKELLKSNFDKMKRDADDLADLAKSLQEELGKSNENVLSLKIVDKAEKIEKLAKRIKGAARGY